MFIIYDVEQTTHNKSHYARFYIKIYPVSIHDNVIFTMLSFQVPIDIPVLVTQLQLLLFQFYQPGYII